MYLFAPCCVTVALPLAPLSNVTEQVNVAPFSTVTSLGHLALVTFADEVDRSSLIPCSTWASSTVFVAALVPVPSPESSQPADASAPIARAVAASSLRKVDIYWRAIATRSSSSGSSRWSASAAASPTSISTQLTSPVKAFGIG